MQNAKDEILTRLREAQVDEIPKRVDLPPAYESFLTREELVEFFISKLEEQTGIVYRAPDSTAILEKLSEIFNQEDIKRVMTSEDNAITSLDLLSWGKKIGIEISTPHEFKDRKSYKDAVFNQVDAGITGVNYAVAESGTLVIAHDSRNARLISLAPILHIAIVSVERVVPVYERVIETVFETGTMPSHVTFITGPSMTADIQGVQFKGMHGPRNLIVILVGQ